jgi:serine/threonine protein kinase
MELCEKVEGNVLLIYEKYEKEIKRCLAFLHSIKFVHKDIKPTNTLYSNELGKFVLSDFGVTHSIKEEIYEKA